MSKITNLKINKNIDIIIENKNNNKLFYNEEEVIKKTAEKLLNIKKVDSIEEGIILVGTILRGLKYKNKEETEDSINIVFEDRAK